MLRKPQRVVRNPVDSATRRVTRCDLHTIEGKMHENNHCRISQHRPHQQIHRSFADGTVHFKDVTWRESTLLDTIRKLYDGYITKP